MQAMKSALALLLVLPLVAGFDVHISNPSETKTVGSSSAILTFTFTETVSDFDASKISVTPAATLGDAQPTDFAYQRYTVVIGDLAHGTEYTVSVPADVITKCDVDGDSCTSPIGAETNEAAEDFVFDTAFEGSIPVLERPGPAVVTDGGMDAREVPFTLTFPRNVFPVPTGDGIWAKDENDNDLEVVVTSYGNKVWEYYVIGENGHQIMTGFMAGGAVDQNGMQAQPSDPEMISADLQIKTDCISRPEWSIWTLCVDGKQSHTNTPVVTFPAFAGGFDCDLTPVTEERDCEVLDDSVSCAARGADACSVFTAGDACDCTPDCVTHANGVGCCPDVATTCDIGCAVAGCDVLLTGYDDSVICSCDYQCANYDDCCDDFDETCANQLCGYKLLTGELKHHELCNAGYVDQGEDLPCFCDQSCQEYGDCCSDYFRVCGAESTCTAGEDAPSKWANCGKTYQDCGCDILCPYYNDCCTDYGVTCAYVSPLPRVHSFVAFSDEQVDGSFHHTDNPNPPPELCNCAASGLFDGDCCGSQVGFFGRRCSCSPDCGDYDDCCPDFEDVC